MMDLKIVFFSFQYLKLFQNGNECYCGNGEKLGKGAYKLSSGCTTLCRNNRHDICGGGWRLSVYNINTGQQIVNNMFTNNWIEVNCSHNAGAKNIHVMYSACKSHESTRIKVHTLSTDKMYIGKDYCSLFEDIFSCYKPLYAILNFSCVGRNLRVDPRNTDELNRTAIVIGVIGGLALICILVVFTYRLRLHWNDSMGNRKNKTNSSSTVHNTIFAPVMPSSEELASYTDLQLQTGIRPYSILNTRTQQSDINRPKVRETSYGSSTSNDYEDIQHQSKTEHYENTHQLQRTESGHEYLDLYDTKETIYPLKGTGCEIK